MQNFFRKEVRENSRTAKNLFISFCVLVIPYLWAGLSYSATLPGETSPGFLYMITHLHPATYLILFLIFALSAANLIFQRYITLSSRPLLIVSKLFMHLGQRKKMKRRPMADPGRPEIYDRPAQDSILAVRKVGKEARENTDTTIRTPLEGVNHPLPKFDSSPGTPRIVQKQSEKTPKSASQEFKFASAVDVPSLEEQERREREQLVVSGTVKGPDGKGIESVIVYLTDPDGNRAGQSCRTMPNTGKFRVLINDPGTYVLNGYKRGFIMENTDPLVLPIESGKIEGFTMRMIPEGCVVQGRVSVTNGTSIDSNLEVNCVCADGRFSRSGRIDATSGEFRIPGILVNSKCLLEIRDSNGAVLTRSEPFETVQKKEIFKEVVLRDSGGITESDTDPHWNNSMSSQPPTS